MKRLHKQLTLFTLSLTGCCTVLYLFTPYKEQMVGVLLGLWISFYNVLFIEKKLRILEERAALSQASRSRGTGMLHRFSIIALAIMLAYKYPYYIDARTVAIGLPLCYLFVFLQQWFEVRREVLALRKG